MTPRDDSLSDSEHYDELSLTDSRESTHMVDIIDVDAVDFQPFLTNESGTGVNYHSSDSPEHKLLLQESFLERERSSFADDTSDSYMDIIKNVQHCFSKWPHRPPSPSPSIEKQGGYSRRYVTVRGAITFIVLAAVIHIVKASSFLNARGTAITQSNNPSSYYPPDGGIPPELQHAYRDTAVRVTASDTPVYWFVPKSGGTTMTRIMSECFGQVIAFEQVRKHATDERIHLLHTPQGTFSQIDTTTPSGLRKAKDLGMLSTDSVDVVVTPYLWDAAHRFGPQHGGRLFSIIHDPVERLMLEYNALQRTTAKNVTLEQFASSMPDNYMVRTLVNTMTGPLDDRHIGTAKDIVKEKFLVGLFNEQAESLKRIQAWFGWRDNEACTSGVLRNAESATPVTIKKESRKILAKTLAFDIELYDYAKLVFREQKALFKK